MKILLLSGGNHPYDQSTPVLENFLEQSGHDVNVREDAEALTDGTLGASDVLVFNTLRIGDSLLNESEQTALKSYIAHGKGFVCIHISGCVPPEWSEYAEITGGGWVMDQSFHPPYGEFSVDVSNDIHPCASGISGFSTEDELYMNIEYREGNEVFMSAEFDGGDYDRNRSGNESIHMPGGTFPLAWTRNYGSGKVFVTLLGHDGNSQQNKSFQRLILNGIDWVSS